MHLSRHQNQIS